MVAAYLRCFVIGPLCGALALAVIVDVCPEWIPAPRLSASVSFNEKAQWLRTALADGQCEILVVGSSMALSSASGPLLSAHATRKVVNLGSWGMSAEESSTLVRAVTRLCRPRAIVMPIFHGDFTSDEPKQIRWDLVGDYLAGGNRLVTYVRTFDLRYVFDQMLTRWRQAGRGRTFYESLDFDPSGGVNLACTGFTISPQRWDGYQRALPRPVRESAVQAVADIARLAKEQNAQFLAATVPLRPVAEASFEPERREKLWARVNGAVAGAGGAFIRIRAGDGFDDRVFADYAHLNACGAARWTQMVLARFGKSMIAATGK